MLDPLSALHHFWILLGKIIGLVPSPHPLPGSFILWASLALTGFPPASAAAGGLLGGEALVTSAGWLSSPQEPALRKAFLWELIRHLRDRGDPPDSGALGCK